MGLNATPPKQELDLLIFRLGEFWGTSWGFEEVFRQLSGHVVEIQQKHYEIKHESNSLGGCLGVFCMNSCGVLEGFRG